MMKPMLSGKAPDDLSSIKFPVLVSPKLDGVRTIIHEGKVISRKMKPIPNAHVQWLYGDRRLEGLDGEMIVGEATAANVFNRTQSAVMRHDGQPEVTFHVFDDMTDPTLPFEKRLEVAHARVTMLARSLPISFGKVPHSLIKSVDELNKIEDRYVSEGFEGVMIRSLTGPYKYGRSTTKEGWLLKLKRWEDAEAVLVDMVELMHNENELTRDELGYAKRSSHKANKVGRGVMGTFKCHWMQDGHLAPIEFEIGTGFTAEDRRRFWEMKEELIGSQVTLKYQQITPDGVPRFPVFKGIRHAHD